MTHRCNIFFAVILNILLLGAVVVDTLPMGSTPDPADIPFKGGTPDEKPKVTSHREGHEFSVNVPIEHIISVQEWADDPEPSSGGPFKTKPDGMYLLVNDDPVFCGAEWKGAIYGVMRENHLTWWRARAYMKTPFSVPEDAVCTGATLTMVVEQPPEKAVDIYPSVVLGYWDGDTIENTLHFGGLPDTQMQNESVTIGPGQTGKAIVFDVTETVDRWFQGWTNNGMCLRCNETLPDQVENHKNCVPVFSGLDTGDNSPTLEIDYFINHAPLASITSDPVSSAMETEPVTFTGEGKDPEGDKIALYEWSSDRDGLLGCGPGLTQITVDNLSVGLHKIRLRVRDDCQEYPRWSEYTYQSIQIKENLPRVTGVEARSVRDGTEGVEFSLGDTVEIVVTAELGTPPYSGVVDISHHIVDVQVVSGEALSEDLVYAWDTTGATPGVYAIDVKIIDSAGKESDMGTVVDDPDLLVSIVDNDPPTIESIIASSRDEEGFEFEPGDSVTITVTAGGGEAELVGETTVLDSQGNPTGTNPYLTDVGGGEYTATWRTDYLDGDTYTVRVSLTDGSGNRASGDIQITIVDTDDPRVGTVEAMLGSQSGDVFPVATSLNVMVEEESHEEGLTGTIDITFGNTLTVYEEPLKELGDGRYYYPWNTKDLEPGWYSINVTLTDEDGNSDPDGLGKKDFTGNRLPDLMVRLTVPIATLVVTDTVPVSGERDVSRGTMIMVYFSQPVDPTTVNTDTMPVHVRDGYPVPGDWEVIQFGAGCRFDPEGVLDPGTAHEVEVKDAVMTFEGVSCSPYSLVFETSIESVMATVEHSPLQNVVFLNATDNITFTMTVDSGEGTISWALDDMKVPGGEGAEYTFHPDGNDPGWHRVEATPLGIEGEPVGWSVYVHQDETGEVGGTEGGGEEVSEDSSGDGGGSIWPLAAGAAVLVVGIMLVLAALVYIRKNAQMPGSGGKWGHASAPDRKSGQGPLPGRNGVVKR